MGCVVAAAVLVLSSGCQAHAPRYGSTRTEDVSQVIFNHSWLKARVPLRNLRVERLEGNLLEVTARLHCKASHTSYRVYVRTEFYDLPMTAGGKMIDSTDWSEFVLEPRKSVHYTASSLVPADDFRIYVYYGEDIGRE